jgi:UDP-3-O-[3-hydroxymyristoyl] glucosamine N-acyltransferase
MPTIRELQSNFLPDARFHGDLDSAVTGLGPFSDTSATGALTFVTASLLRNGAEDLLRHAASTFITDHRFSDSDIGDLVAHGKNLVLTNKPRLQAARLSRWFERPTQRLQEVDWKGVRIHVGAGAYIDPSAEIGPGTTLHANVVIHAGTRIGARCVLHSGAVIGADGFGYEQDDEGKWFRIAHLGGVVIGNDVEIGANTCVDRGTFGDTRIDDNVKIDNLVHIAHNVVVRDNALIIAHAMVAGSVTVGKNVWIAPCASIRQKLSIGDDAVIGMGAVVVKDVAPGTTVMGVPATRKEPSP